MFEAYICTAASNAIRLCIFCVNYSFPAFGLSKRRHFNLKMTILVRIGI
jgi:hypothetical protein